MIYRNRSDALATNYELVMQELIQQMANVQYTENMTEEQVDAMAGSETLRQQASLFGATRNYKVEGTFIYLSSIFGSNNCLTKKCNSYAGVE
jgi:hypothetical protein